MDPQSIYTKSGTPNVPYGNCHTRIISLLQHDIPENATEHQYKSLYSSIVSSKTSQSQLLTDAVNSIIYGIAPPVAFPTETVYGLCADATNRASIAGIFAAKGRPSDNPLIVHVASRQHLERLTGEPLPDIYTKLIEEYWPGPLTILVPVPKTSVFAPNVHPGQMTIGFRVPASKYARFFIAATDRPLAAPSANSSGKPSPTTAEHVMEDMKGKINFILDGGSCSVGVESTVVDGLCDPPLILRPGGVSQADLIRHGKKHGNNWIRTAIGYNQQHHRNTDGATQTSALELSEAPRAPGMKYKHYAPRGKLILMETQQTYDRVNSEIDHIIDSTLITTESSLKSAINRENLAAPAAPHNDTSIAILTTTTWSPFVDLPLDTTPQLIPSSPFAQANGSIRADHHTLDTTKHQAIQKQTPTHTQMQGQGQIQGQMQVQRATYRSHKIYSVSLGQTPKQIARSLFAALRTCDTLNCNFILAEMPVKPQPRSPPSSLASFASHATSTLDTEDHENRNKNVIRQGGLQEEKEEEEEDFYYDAVVERMRKAASLVL